MRMHSSSSQPGVQLTEWQAIRILPVVRRRDAPRVCRHQEPSVSVCRYS
jgi:hypothetical protein